MAGDVAEVGEAFGLGAAELTGALSADADVLDRTVHAIARTGATLPGVDHAGVALVHRGALHPQATGDPVADDLDAVQAALGEGPAVAAAAAGRTCDVPDLAAAGRWPGFTEVAARHAVRGVLALPLTTHDGVLGVLTLSTRSQVGPPGRTLAASLAAPATVALFGAQRIAGLSRAVLTRDVIGQAKGILMQRDGVDDEGAFALLVEASQTTNIKLVDVAAWLVGQAREPQPTAPDHAPSAPAPAPTGRGGPPR
jgi:GAF domain-containing protein